MPSSNLIAKLRRAASRRQNDRCYYCRYLMWETELPVFASRFGLSPRAAARFQCTAEHLVARCDGGRDTRKNIVAACTFCNGARHKADTPRSAPAYRDHVQRRLAAGKWHPAPTQSLAFPIEASNVTEPKAKMVLTTRPVALCLR